MECALALNANPKDFNKHQPFLVREMVETYHQLYLAQSFHNFLNSIHNDKVKELYNKLHLIYLKSKILADGEYFRNWFSAAQFKEFRNDILKLLEELRPDTYAITELFPIPNKYYGPFGNEDLQGYD